MNDTTSIDSKTLYSQLEKTYEKFGYTYEYVLNEYYAEQKDIIKQLYVNSSKPIKGIIFVDGTYKIGNDLLTELFNKYSTCFVLCVCLMPAERHKISQYNVNKSIYFENLSIMRYMDFFFKWLSSSFSSTAKKLYVNDQIVIYNNTLYYCLKNWLRENNFFRISFSIEKLQCTIENN